MLHSPPLPSPPLSWRQVASLPALAQVVNILGLAPATPTAPPLATPMATPMATSLATPLATRGQARPGLRQRHGTEGSTVSLEQSSSVEVLSEMEDDQRLEGGHLAGDRSSGFF